MAYPTDADNLEEHKRALRLDEGISHVIHPTARNSMRAFVYRKEGACARNTQMKTKSTFVSLQKDHGSTRQNGGKDVDSKV